MSDQYPPPPDQPPQAPQAPPPPPPPPPGGYSQQPPYGQQQPPYGQQPAYGQYGASGYDQYGGPPKTSGKATAALIVAIVGLFICGPIAGIIALVLAGQAKTEIAQSGGRITGEGQVKAARIIAIIEIVLGVLGFIVVFSM